MSTDNAAPSYVRFRIVGVSMLMAFILYLDRVCLGEIVKSDSFARDVAISDEELGLVLSAFFYAYALFQIPTGWASDRFGARKILTAYIVLWSLSTALTGLMSTFAGLLALRLLCGAAEAGAGALRPGVEDEGRGAGADGGVDERAAPEGDGLHGGEVGVAARGAAVGDDDGLGDGGIKRLHVGGVKGGFVHGATDDFGYKAVHNRTSVHDIQATIMHLLGIDHLKLTFRFQGRDFRLTDVGGHVVKPLLA